MNELDVQKESEKRFSNSGLFANVIVCFRATYVP